MGFKIFIPFIDKTDEIHWIYIGDKNLRPGYTDQNKPADRLVGEGEVKQRRSYGSQEAS